MSVGATTASAVIARTRWLATTAETTLRRRQRAFRHRAEIRKIPAAAGGRFEQGSGVGLLLIAQHLSRGALFDHAPVLHHHDVVADLGCDPQIMCDEEQ